MINCNVRLAIGALIGPWPNPISCSIHVQLSADAARDRVRQRVDVGQHVDDAGGRAGFAGADQQQAGRGEERRLKDRARHQRGGEIDSFEM